MLRCLENALLSSLTSCLSISPAADNREKLQTTSGLRVLQAGVGSVSDCVAARLAGPGREALAGAGAEAGGQAGLVLRWRGRCLRVVPGLYDVVWLPLELCSVSPSRKLRSLWERDLPSSSDTGVRSAAGKLFSSSRGRGPSISVVTDPVGRGGESAAPARRRDTLGGLESQHRRAGHISRHSTESSISN